MAGLEPKQIVAVPSLVMLVQHSPEQTSQVTTTTPTKKKEIRITWRGGYHFRFSLWLVGGAGSDRAIGQVYRNGGAYGAQHRTEDQQLTPQLFEEDLAGWEEGDLAQLYVSCATANRNAVASNFGIWGEFQLRPPSIPAGEVTLTGA